MVDTIVTIKVVVIVIKIVMLELITEQGAEKDQGQAFQLVRGLRPGGKPDHHDGHGDGQDHHGRVIQPRIQGSGLHLWS